MHMSLGKLDTVDVREVWKHEAHDFTQWMLANADILGDILGLQMELSAAEHKVGGFSLDLIGKDLVSGETIIVENQLEPTDHGHLGQLLTYAGGTDPTTIVWCSPSFRDEHRAALDWLNDRTGENTRFFGVQLAAVRIDDSRPAPLFSLVAKPNDWAKQVHTQKATALKGKALLYQDFWSALLDRIHESYPGWTKSAAAPPQSWITFPYGVSHIWYAAVFTQTGPAVEIYFGSSDPATNLAEFEKFAARQDVMIETFGEDLVFDPLEGKKACRIRFYRPNGGNIEEYRDPLLDWFTDVLGRLKATTEAIREGF